MNQPPELWSWDVRGAARGAGGVTHVERLARVHLLAAMREVPDEGAEGTVRRVALALNGGYHYGPVLLCLRRGPSGMLVFEEPERRGGTRRMFIDASHGSSGPG